MITPAQLRAARGLLDWTRVDLAKAAGISPETIKNIEHGVFRPQEGTRSLIALAFRAHDVEFIENEGVIRRRDTVQRLEGPEGFRRLMDDVYEAAQHQSAVVNGDKPICLSNINDTLFMKYLGDYLIHHAHRMNALKNVKIHILIDKAPSLTIPGETAEQCYREYRQLPDQATSNVPFYVYGDKLAIIVFDEEPAPQIVIISSALIARAYREQFNILWKTAQPVAAALPEHTKLESL